MNNTQSKRHGLSKSRLLLHRQCPKRLWLKAHCPELEEVDDCKQARFATGTYGGEVAQQQYQLAIGKKAALKLRGNV